MKSMTRYVLVCVLFLAVVGCSKAHEEASQPAEPAEAPSPEPPPAPADSPKTVDEAVELHAAGKYELTAPPRDLAKELHDALGSPADCISLTVSR